MIGAGAGAKVAGASAQAFTNPTQVKASADACGPKAEAKAHLVPGYIGRRLWT